jgi:hypothetical protein
MAYVIAAEMSINIRTTSGPAFEPAGELRLTEPHAPVLVAGLAARVGDGAIAAGRRG